MDSKYKKEEVVGLMVMKDGKAWGTVYDDGNSVCYGWTDPIHAKISEARFCKYTNCFTYAGSHYEEELKKGKFVKVRRTTTIVVDFEVEESD